MHKAETSETQGCSSIEKVVARGERRAKAATSELRASEQAKTPGQLRYARRKAGLLSRRALAQSIAAERAGRGEDFLGRSAPQVAAETISALADAHAAVMHQRVRFEDALRVAARERLVYGPVMRAVALARADQERARKEEGLTPSEALELLELAIASRGGKPPRRGGYHVSSGPVSR